MSRPDPARLGLAALGSGFIGALAGLCGPTAKVLFESASAGEVTGGVGGNFLAQWSLSGAGPDDPREQREAALTDALRQSFNNLRPGLPAADGWFEAWERRIAYSPQAPLSSLTCLHDESDDAWQHRRGGDGEPGEAFWPFILAGLAVMAWDVEHEAGKPLPGDLAEYVSTNLPAGLADEGRAAVALRQPATNYEILEQLALIRRDLAARHATDRARERNVPSPDMLAVRDRLDAKDAELRRSANDLERTAAERDVARAEIAHLVAEREGAAQTFFAADPALAEEVRVFHDRIRELAATDDPALAAAYLQYADGVRVQALPVIQAIVSAKQAAAAAAFAARHNAEPQRPLAAIVLEMLDRGEQTTGQAIAEWEKLAGFAPADFQAWVELGRLYQQAGRLPDARRDAEQALASAQDDRERAAAFSELGDVEREAGDLAAARHAFQQSLDIALRLAQANPASALAQRDVLVSYWKLGELTGEREWWAKALAVIGKLTAEGRLAPRDAWMLDVLRTKAAATE